MEECSNIHLMQMVSHIGIQISQGGVLSYSMTVLVTFFLFLPQLPMTIFKVYQNIANENPSIFWHEREAPKCSFPWPASADSIDLGRFWCGAIAPADNSRNTRISWLRPDRMYFYKLFCKNDDLIVFHVSHVYVSGVGYLIKTSWPLVKRNKFPLFNMHNPFNLS